ncbi:MAG: outer membrane beta-barrel protein [Betaproteobacteria bacterium]
MTLRVPKACLLAAALLYPTQASAQASETFTVNGYSSFEFEKMLGDKGRGDPNGSFDADLIDLVVNFKPDSRLRVASDLTWEHGAATEDGRGNVAVEYAFAEFYFRDWLKVRAGKMFTAFGIYNEIHTAKPAFLTVKEPLATNKNDKFGSDLRFYPRWQAGAAVLGDMHFGSVDADYTLQVGNGEQSATNPFEEDDNTAKSVTARLRVHPTQALTVGASLYRDSLTEYSAEGESTGGRTHLTSYGAQLQWVPSALGLELEYVRGSLDPSREPSRTRSALTAMAYYRIRDRFTPYFRYEWLDPDSTISGDTAGLYIYGLNARVVKGLFLKAELDTVTTGSHNPRFEGQGYTEAKAAVVVGF